MSVHLFFNVNNFASVSNRQVAELDNMVSDYKLNLVVVPIFIKTSMTLTRLIYGLLVVN